MAKFEIKKAKDGQFYFVLKANNHKVIATGEMYKRKASVTKAILSIEKSMKYWFEVIDLTI